MTTQAPEHERPRAEEQAKLTSDKVLALLALWQAGRIADSEFPSAVSISIYRGKVIASRLADILISTLANVPPVGLVPGPQHLDRLEDSARTALEDPESASERLQRLSTAEVMESHSRTLNAALREHRLRWREDVAEDACPVCLPYADREHEAGEEFVPHHPKCRCEPVPVKEDR